MIARWRRAMGAAVTVAAIALGSTDVAHAQARPQIGDGTKHARATIIAISASADRAQLLVTLAVDPGWHVSWRNPGETGLPTRLSWSLPAGVRVQNETWPVPVITHTPVGVTHTLEGDVPWLVDLTIPAASDADRLIVLTMRYGICRDVCIPEQITAQGVLPGRATGVRAMIPPALRRRLAVTGAPIPARRRSATELCVDRVPLVSGSAVPEIIADSGLNLDAALTLTAASASRSHGFVMKIPATVKTLAGTAILAVRGADGVATRLDFQAPAPGCRAR